ncbi:MAG: alpha-glucosidase C-terminal domain-containing protein, partial [Propionibacteriaceae bacterium]|nr:alpha-glucosidase C-terminal domain-containing protein [Propionibacteriaceae bacterium]
TPVQWDDSPHAGFTTGEPWIEVAANYPEVNAAAAVTDPDSVFHHYRKLIELRKADPLVTTGRYELLDREHPSVYAYLRRGDGEAFLVVNNFYADPVAWQVPAEVGEWADTALVLGNYPDPEFGDGSVALRPYESVVLRLTN